MLYFRDWTFLERLRRIFFGRNQRFGRATGIACWRKRVGKISSIVTRVFLMRIIVVINSDKESFGMPCKKEIKKKNRREDGEKKGENLEVEEVFQKAINDDAKESSHAVIDAPSGDKKIARFSLIRIATVRATIQRSKPISQRTGEEQREKDPILSADWAEETEGAT
jgi:hypothetical protein